MAASHAGVLEMSCSKCRRDPSLKDLWGCEKPKQEAVKAMPSDDEPYYYYSCPNLFISQSVSSFIEKYYAVKSGMVSLGIYEDIEARFFAMKNYYEYWLEFFKAKLVKNG